MGELQDRRKFKRMFYSKTLLIILIILTVFLIRPVWNAYNKMVYSSQSLGDMKEQIESLKNREIFLAGEIERLKTEKGIEEEIRRKFNLAKEGEGVVIITSGQAESSIEDSENKNTLDGYFEKFKTFFDR